MPKVPKFHDLAAETELQENKVSGRFSPVPKSSAIHFWELRELRKQASAIDKTNSLREFPAIAERAANAFRLLRRKHYLPENPGVHAKLVEATYGPD